MAPIWRVVLSPRALLCLLGFVSVAACRDSPTEGAEALTSFAVVVPASADENAAFPITVTAVGSRSSSPLATFSGEVGLRIAGGAGTITPATITLASGTGSGQVVVRGIAGQVTIEATGSGVGGTARLAVHGDTVGRLRGEPGAVAATAIPTRSFTANADDYRVDHPDLRGVYISFNTLLMTFALDATVAQVNDVLQGINARIVGGSPGVEGEAEGLLFVRVPTTDHSQLIALVDRLRTNPIVESVAPDVLLEEDVVPSPNDGNPGDWRWSLTPSGGNWGLERVRAPQMWNLNPAIARNGRTTTIGVFDSGFADNHPDLAYAQNQTPGRQTAHGTHVAGIIGARFDNGTGIDGINPYANLVVRALPRLRAVSDTIFERRQSYGEAFLQGMRDLLRSRDDIRVVNISMGYKWGRAGIDPRANERAREIATDQGRQFRVLLRQLGRNRVPLIVVSAGNDSDSGLGIQEARWSSPFNNAGILLAPPFSSRPNPILVVESVRNVGGDLGRTTRSAFSNTGGHLSAPGQSILSTYWTEAGDTLYESLSGTSMATPHVAGLVGYLYAIEPGLTHAEVRTILLSTAEEAGFASARIDAYGAVLAIDRVRGGTAVRRMLLDVTGDGVFTDADIAAYLNAFAGYEPFDHRCSVTREDPASCPIYSRFNLNGSGVLDNATTGEFDLNRDGVHGNLTIEIEGEAVTFDETGLTDLEILCYYAYSSVFTGDPTRRSQLVRRRCRQGGVTPSVFSSGGDHSCGLVADGRAVCWGRNSNGQVGDGSTIDRTRPVAVVTEESFASIAAGGHHTCALTADGRAFCWGSNGHGQLGSGPAAQRNTPVAVSTMLRFTFLSAGHAHTCGLTTDERAFCWGENRDGQLGDGTFVDRDVPVAVQPAQRFTSLVSTGVGHTCALNAEGDAHCWGANRGGQLGDGTFANRNRAVEVRTPLRFVSLSGPARGWHTCGLAAPGQLTWPGRAFCWGANGGGQLGDGNSADRNTPVAVETTRSFASLSIGGHFSCGLTTVEQVYCWGQNTYGQLGDRTTTSSSAPVRVGTSARFESISAGHWHTCGLDAEGRAYCWGRNHHGQLGDGTLIDRTSPVRVDTDLRFRLQ